MHTSSLAPICPHQTCCLRSCPTSVSSFARLSSGACITLQSINFQELAADLAEITFKFPFRIPPYFALVRVVSLAL